MARAPPGSPGAGRDRRPPTCGPSGRRCRCSPGQRLPVPRRPVRRSAFSSAHRPDPRSRRRPGRRRRPHRPHRPEPQPGPHQDQQPGRRRPPGLLTGRAVTGRGLGRSGVGSRVASPAGASAGAGPPGLWLPAPRRRRSTTAAGTSTGPAAAAKTRGGHHDGGWQDPADQPRQRIDQRLDVDPDHCSPAACRRISGTAPSTLPTLSITKAWNSG